MEGIKTFEDSHKELDRILTATQTGSVTIDFTKLDATTSGAMRQVIYNTALENRRRVEKVIYGSNNA